MTNAEKVLAGLDESIRAGVKAWNEAYRAKNFEAIQKADAEIVKDTKEYAEVAQAICFERFDATEKPMYEAIKTLMFTALRVKEVANKDSGIVQREVIEAERQIDLLKFDKTRKESAAHDPMWQYKIQRFNQLLALRAAQELKIDPKSISDSFYMSEKAKELDMGKTPASNTQILKLLQECVDAIIYEEGEHGNVYKASSKDVAYLLMIYTKKGKKALTAAVAKHGAMRGFIAEICHRIITDKAYRLEFKQSKENIEVASDTSKTTNAA